MVASEVLKHVHEYRVKQISFTQIANDLVLLLELHQINSQFLRRFLDGVLVRISYMIFVSAIFGHHQAAVIHQFNALVALVLDFDGKPYNVVAVELKRAWFETDLRGRNDDVLEEFDLLHQRGLLLVFERRGIEEAAC